MKKRTLKNLWLVLMVSSLTYTFSYGQTNLVPNPSFEIYDTCPNSPSKINYAHSWFQPNTGTSDYFNACSITPPNMYSVPTNFIGYQYANSGNGYAGLLASEDVSGNIEYREYLGVKLTNTLVNGQKYYTSFFINLADSSRYATSRIGMLFTSDSISQSNWDTIDRIPQVQNPLGNFFLSKTNWQQVKGEFIANGTEQFLYVGNFFAQNQTDTLFVLNGGQQQYYNFPYYYIDDICVSTDSMYAATWSSAGQSQTIDRSVKIFPNPTTENITILNSEENEPFDISIRNILGQELFFQKEIKGDSFAINVSNFEKGVFFISIRKKNKSVSYKFLKT